MTEITINLSKTLLFAHHAKEFFKHVAQSSLVAIYFNILKNLSAISICKSGA